MKRTALASFAVVLAWVGVFSPSISTAQPPQQGKPLQFEVAAIKPGNPQVNYSLSSNGPSGGQFRLVNTPLKQWVEMGFSIRDYALKAPAWTATSRFDLNARMPAGKPATQEAIAEMIRSLLIERFGLKWHEESQSVSGYELVTDKKVLVQPAGLLERLHGTHGSSSGSTSIAGNNMPMSEFAKELEKVLGRPVVDETHLSGGFDIKVRWRPSDPAELATQQRYGKQYGVDVDNLPSSVFTALQEQLGLRLQSAKVPSKVVVVDNINRQPSEN